MKLSGGLVTPYVLPMRRNGESRVLWNVNAGVGLYIGATKWRCERAELEKVTLPWR